jgi:hypothetical protein
MMPPAATAFTTASDVQLAALPLPTVRSGLDVSTALASAGTVALPFGLPAWSGVPGAAPAPAALLADADALGDALVDALADGAAATALPAGSSPSPMGRTPDLFPPHPARTNAATSVKADKRVVTGRAKRGLSCTDRL